MVWLKRFVPLSFLLSLLRRHHDDRLLTLSVCFSLEDFKGFVHLQFPMAEKSIMLTTTTFYSNRSFWRNYFTQSVNSNS